MQEIDHPNINILNNIYNIKSISKKEREIEKKGGGTMTINNINITHQKEESVNKDCNLTRIVIDGVFVIWIGNIYLNKGLPKQIQKLFSIIQNKIPTNELQNLILIGDFNININNKSPKLTLLNSLCKQFNLNINNPGRGTRYQNTLDFLISGNGIEATIKENLQSCSDHNILIWDIKFKTTQKQRTIYIPNKKLAQEITETAIMNEKVQKATDLLQTFLQLKKIKRKKAFLRIKPKKPKKNIYKNLLLSITEESTIKETLNSYWTNFWQEIEELRYSALSKEAFNTLKTICKYHLYEKRDGSIVNQILGENEEIITDPKQVSAILIEVLQDIQLSEQFNKYSGNLPFPDLPPLEEIEIKQLLSKLSSGKAISFDLFSDMILKNEAGINKLSKILQDLWSGELNKIDNLNELFKARLIALNKVHPNTPKPAEFRPIIILSLIIKIMECRWLPKLQEYVITKLCPSQTGFVPGQGVFTNIFRTIKRIRQRTDKKQHVFGLFIDFKSAYNYTRHDLLFERLEKILTKDEIKFQKAIYDRLIIQSEDSSFRPNLGVAQGSVISPSLFDIYTEPLLLELNKHIPLEDILAYADDILILCEDIQTLNACLTIIERWSTENNLKINKKKSAILEFINRRSKYTLLKTGDTHRDYPIVDEYKYLGTWLNQKLNLEPQIKFINKKINFMRHKLSPCLFNATLELRKNLWQVFVVPLFEFTLPIFHYEDSRSNKLNLERLLRSSFKNFTGLGKTVDTKLIEDLMGYNLYKRSQHMHYISEKKWESRLKGEKYNPIEDHNKELACPTKITNKCKYFSKLMIKYINIQTALCPKCKEINILKRCTSDHLSTTHNIKTDSIYTIIDYLKNHSRKMVINERNQKVSQYKNRKEMIQLSEEILEHNYKKIKLFFSM